MSVSTPQEAILAGAKVLWNHIDGPLMTWGGSCHWLTWPERMLIWTGFRTVDEIACMHWPHLKRLRERVQQEIAA